MKMKALKPLGEEKPAAINDTKFSDTLVDVPLPEDPDSELKTETKTKTDQPSADSVQNIQDLLGRHVHVGRSDPHTGRPTLWIFLHK